MGDVVGDGDEVAIVLSPDLGDLGVIVEEHCIKEVIGDEGGVEGLGVCRGVESAADWRYWDLGEGSEYVVWGGGGAWAKMGMVVVAVAVVMMIVVVVVVRVLEVIRFLRVGIWNLHVVGQLSRRRGPNPAQQGTSSHIGV